MNTIRLSARDRLFAVLGALRLPAVNGTQQKTTIRPASLHGRAVKAHSKAENREAIQFHYDVSNDFYAL